MGIPLTFWLFYSFSRIRSDVFNCIEESIIKKAKYCLTMLWEKHEVEDAKFKPAGVSSAKALAMFDANRDDDNRSGSKPSSAMGASITVASSS